MTATSAVKSKKELQTGGRRFEIPTLVAIAFLILIATAAIWPSLLAPGDPNSIALESALKPPSLNNVFGTDQSGRDLFTRIVHGTRPSLAIGIGAALVSLSFAIMFGGAAALTRGIIARIFDGLIEINLAFPIVLLALLLVVALGPSPQTLILAVGIGYAPGYARMVRGQVLAVKQEPYVEAARALGHSSSRIVFQHIFPNALKPLIAIFALSIGQSIVWASGLALLGLGVPPPSPEWGALLDAGRIYITSAWWLEIVPGLAIALVAVAVTTVSRSIQKSQEERTR